MEIYNTKTQKKIKDKSDRATRDSVLDNRTLTILQKLMKRNMLTNLQGCLSTGKEANVYAANASSLLNCKLVESKLDNMYPCAIKIYQTSIMEFKDRLKYIQSEKRFTTFCNTNPRKLVKLWAEKEVRNLKRLNKNSIPSPTPIYVKNNIVIMTLIEENGTDNTKHKYTNIENTLQDIAQQDNEMIYPIDNNLNDLTLTKNEIEDNTKLDTINQESFVISEKQNTCFKPAPRLKDYACDDYNDLYDQSLEIITNMYKKCGLIHADYSEYNLLVAKNIVYVIDVGQSVEKDHDNADEFLIKDIHNINMFFKRKGCNVRTVNAIYEFVTGKHIPFCLKGIDLEPGVTIPDNIHDVTDEKDFAHFLRQTKKIDEIDEDFHVTTSTEINVNITNNKEDIEKDDSCNEKDNSKTRKEQKKIVKEAQREKRKSKIPKKEKKRKEKLNKKRK